MLDYGYRSACCNAPIRAARKKIRNSTLTTRVWVCCRCRKSDVLIVEYNKDATAASTQNSTKRRVFVADDEVEYPDQDDA